MLTNQYPSLRTRLAIALFILAATFGAGISSILYVNFKNELRNDMRHRLENITALAGLQQSGDDFVLVKAQDDEFFQKIQEQNAAIKRSEPDIRFVYAMQKDADGIYFVVDARTSPDEPDISNYGDRYESASDLLIANFDTLDQTIVEEDFYEDEFGCFLSAYTPIYDSANTRVGVLGVDILCDTVIQREATFLYQIIFIYMLALVALFFGGFAFANSLAKPIVLLRDMANKISQGNFNARITAIPHTRELAELAHDLNNMTDNLGTLITDLEQRVLERTATLTKKADQLRTATSIARQSAENQDLSLLLSTAVDLIAEQFDCNHAGLFLLNEVGDEVILQAASSDGGKRMLERGYSVSIGPTGIISSVVSMKKPRILHDLGADAGFFNNPDLPLMRSAILLPLIARGKILGILDLQSNQPQAFHNEDTDVLQTLADQVAVAIDNIRLLGETEAVLLQLEAITNLRAREAWSQRLEGQTRAFTYTPLGLRAEKSNIFADSPLHSPIVLRGQKIGEIALEKKDKSTLSKLDMELVNEVAYQVGLAVDNLRLLEDAQQRARREQIIGELATRFSQALDIDSLLQTAAREMGQLPDIVEATVYIGQLPDQAPPKRRPRRTTG